MDAKWLKTQFDLNPDKTKTALADSLGLEPPAVSKILKGTRQIKAQEYILMRDFFGMPNDGGKISSHATSYVIEKFEQSNTLEERSFDTKDSDWVIPQKIISRRTSASSDQIKVFENKEHLMEPDFKYGEHVLVDICDTKVSPPGAFLIYDGLGHMIRHCEIVPNSSPSEIKISAHDKSFATQSLYVEDILIVGRVIAKLQMV